MKSRIVQLAVILISSVVIGLAASLPTQAISQSKLVSTIEKQIGPAGPTYVFKLYAIEAMSNYHYRLDICDESGQEVLQSEKIRNGISLEDKSGSFLLVDVNSDKYDDVKVLGGFSKGRAWYKVWLYDAQSRKYVWASRNSE